MSWFTWLMPGTKEVLDSLPGLDADPVTTPQPSSSNLPQDNDDTPKSNKGKGRDTSNDLSAEEKENINKQIEEKRKTNPVTKVFNSLNSTITEAGKATMNGVSETGKAIGNALNPYNYFSTVEQIEARKFNWVEEQADIRTFTNKKLYPFTTDDPTATWYQKWYTLFAGESAVDKAVREAHLEYYQKTMDALFAQTRATGEGSAAVASVGLSGGETPALFNVWSKEILEAGELAEKLRAIDPAYVNEAKYWAGIDEGAVQHPQTPSGLAGKLTDIQKLLSKEDLGKLVTDSPWVEGSETVRVPVQQPVAIAASPFTPSGSDPLQALHLTPAHALVQEHEAGSSGQGQEVVEGSVTAYTDTETTPTLAPTPVTQTLPEDGVSSDIDQCITEYVDYKSFHADTNSLDETFNVFCNDLKDSIGVVQKLRGSGELQNFSDLDLVIIEGLLGKMRKVTGYILLGDLATAKSELAQYVEIISSTKKPVFKHVTRTLTDLTELLAAVETAKI